MKNAKLKILMPFCLSVLVVDDVRSQSLTETIKRAVIDYPSINAAKFNAEAAEQVVKLLHRP